MHRLWSDHTAKAQGRLVRFSGGPWEGVQHDVQFDGKAYPDVATRLGRYRFHGVNAAGEVVYAYEPGTRIAA